MTKILNNKIFKSIFTLLKTCFFAILIVYILFVGYQRLSGNKSIFGYRMFTVATGSMTGAYNINDVIAVKDYDVNKLRVGDDIAYSGNRGGLENKFVTHRIIKIEDATNGGKIIVTKGVKNQVEDPPIRRERRVLSPAGIRVTDKQVLGKVVGVVPIVSQVNHIINTQAGFFFLIFCPLVIVIMVDILQTMTDEEIENNKLRKIVSKNNKNTDEEII